MYDSNKLDIEFNLEALYYSLRNIGFVQDSLNTLIETLNEVVNSSNDISGDVPEVSYLTNDLSSIRNYLNNDLDNIYNRIERTKNLLIKNDQDAKYFFMNIDAGVLDFDLNLVGIPVYNQLDFENIEAYGYAGGSIESSGCGLCCLTTTVSLATGILFMPGQLAMIAYNDDHGSDKSGKMMHILSFIDDSVPDQYVNDKTYNDSYTRTLTGNKGQELFNSFCDLADEGKLFTIQLGGAHFVLGAGHIKTDDGDKLIIVDSNGGRKGNSGNILLMNAEELGEAFGDPNSTVYNVIDPYKFTASDRVTNNAEYTYVTKISSKTMNSIEKYIDNEEKVVDLSNYDKQSNKYENVIDSSSDYDYIGKPV